MKKIILWFNKETNDYEVYEKLRTNCLELYYLVMNFEPFDDSWIQSFKIPNSNNILIWSLDSIKEKIENNNESNEKHKELEQKYKAYCDKREQEIPNIVINISDYEKLKQTWKKIKEEKSQYVIFTLDDSGPLDKVDIINKNELSQQDLQNLQHEHIKYLKYEKARKKYIQNHSDYSDVWRSPADDEYEADIMKYYENQ